jgi:succinate-semialdehyde dehydrogenase/glutarate-semialdehyde dehydrogenase
MISTDGIMENAGDSRRGTRARPSIRSRLKDNTLLKESAFVGGGWQDAQSGHTFEVTNPSTGEILGEVPDLGTAETRLAIEAAYVAQKRWEKLAAKERSLVMRRWYELVLSNLDDLAIILTSEMGKPLAEARAEILYGAAYIEW